MTNTTTKPVAGEHGLLVPILRQAWALRHDPRIGQAMRRDIVRCIAALRHNRKPKIKSAAAKADILATYAARKAAIEAVKPIVNSYVLQWADRIRYVCGTTRDPFIAGFEHAILFGDRQAAIAFLRATSIRDGNQQAPGPANAFMAKQGALAKLAEVTAMIEAQKVEG